MRRYASLIVAASLATGALSVPAAAADLTHGDRAFTRDNADVCTNQLLTNPEQDGYAGYLRAKANGIECSRSKPSGCVWREQDAIYPLVTVFDPSSDIVLRFIRAERACSP